MKTPFGKIGYACIDLDQKESFKTCRLKTFKENGLDYIGELIWHNINLLEKIILHNAQRGIELYRISSSLFPWKDYYTYEEIPQWQQIVSKLQAIGKFATLNKLRLSFHPGHFTVLGSENIEVQKRAIADLIHHGEILDLMEQPKNHWSKINIHIGTTRPTKSKAIEKFIENFKLYLPYSVTSRLTLENDDKAAGYTVQELYNVWKKIKTPIVFDTLHYQCNPGDLTYTESLQLAISTWPENIPPIVHHSSSKKLEEVASKKSAHADYLYEKFSIDGIVAKNGIDIMLEAKAKNIALQKFYSDFYA